MEDDSIGEESRSPFQRNQPGLILQYNNSESSIHPTPSPPSEKDGHEEKNDVSALRYSMMGSGSGGPITSASSASPQQPAASSANNTNNISSSSAAAPPSIVPPNTEVILAQELLKLSVPQRQQALEDIHGVSEMPQETESGLVALLEQFDQILAQEETTNELYRAAVLQNRDYITSREFRLSFLRAEEYNVLEAKARLMRHLELKARILGLHQLGLHICMDDLDANALKCLKSGLGQHHPWTDRSGRAVFSWHTPLRFGADLKTRVGAILNKYLHGQFYPSSHSILLAFVIK